MAILATMFVFYLWFDGRNGDRINENQPHAQQSASEKQPQQEIDHHQKFAGGSCPTIPAFAVLLGDHYPHVQNYGTNDKYSKAYLLTAKVHPEVRAVFSSLRRTATINTTGILASIASIQELFFEQHYDFLMAKDTTESDYQLVQQLIDTRAQLLAAVSHLLLQPERPGDDLVRQNYERFIRSYTKRMVMTAYNKYKSTGGVHDLDFDVRYALTAAGTVF